jgi:hypothetical protein
MISRKIREDRANRMLGDLDTLPSSGKYSFTIKANAEETTARRECFKLLQAETGVLHLLPAEDRLGSKS